MGEPLFVTRDLTVEYRGADNILRPALNGLSSSIRHGETIGVAGRSGCGKTTWLRTLMPWRSSGRRRDSGRRRVDRRVAPGHRRTCRLRRPEPLRLCRYDRREHRLWLRGDDARSDSSSGERTCIHDEIMALPDGYDATVAERGQNLSGGQKQRIALARIFLKNPPILILDEGTSAFDNISERLVQPITAARADRTVILVAHRLSTLREADRILVFDGGRIVETGTYSELVRQGGVFAELVRSAEEIDERRKPRPTRRPVHQPSKSKTRRKPTNGAPWWPRRACHE